MSERDLEKEYSPTLNTKRFQDHEKPHEEVIKKFMEVTKNQTLLAREKYKVRSNVRYGGEDDMQVVDIYFKDKEEGTPIFVFFHGGYWQLLSKEYAGSFSEPLVEKGYRVLAVDYNLCPKVSLEELVEQTKTFFKWLFHYGSETNASTISISGHSAGAHLSLLALTEDLLKTPGSERLSSFFLISGVYDLQELWKLECVNSKNILGLDAQKAIKLSPLLWDFNIELLNKRNVKQHLLCSENDSKTFISQNQQIYEKFKNANWNLNNLKLRIFENYDHFDIIENVAIKNTEINQYILKYLEHTNTQ